MGKRIYTTNEWDGYGKQNRYHNEYEQDGDTVTKFHAHRWKSFDGHESEWQTEREEVESWKTDDPDMPDWLHQYIDED